MDGHLRRMIGPAGWMSIAAVLTFLQVCRKAAQIKPAAPHFMNIYFTNPQLRTSPE
jgi:hypothetical protein